MRLENACSFSHLGPDTLGSPASSCTALQLTTKVKNVGIVNCRLKDDLWSTLHRLVHHITTLKL